MCGEWIVGFEPQFWACGMKKSAGGSLPESISEYLRHQEEAVC